MESKIPEKYKEAVKNSMRKYPRNIWTIDELKTIWMVWGDAVNKREFCLEIHRDYRKVKYVYGLMNEIYENEKRSLTEDDFHLVLEEIK